MDRCEIVIEVNEILKGVHCILGAVKELCEAGLNSIRVSTNSARESVYTPYYRPNNYVFADILESLKIVRSYGGWASLNYFVFPGMTDSIEEY